MSEKGQRSGIFFDPEWKWLGYLYVYFHFLLLFLPLPPLFSFSYLPEQTHFHFHNQYFILTFSTIHIPCIPFKQYTLAHSYNKAHALWLGSKGQHYSCVAGQTRSLTFFIRVISSLWVGYELFFFLERKQPRCSPLLVQNFCCMICHHLSCKLPEQQGMNHQ